MYLHVPDCLREWSVDDKLVNVLGLLVASLAQYGKSCIRELRVSRLRKPCAINDFSNSLISYCKVPSNMSCMQSGGNPSVT